MENDLPCRHRSSVDAAQDPGGEDVTGSDDGLEFPCRNCGAFVPSRAKRCPHCGTEVGTEEESVEAILEELTSLLNDDVDDGEADARTSTGEGPPEKAPKEVDSASTRPDGKVRYKKVKKWPQ